MSFIYDLKFYFKYRWDVVGYHLKNQHQQEILMYAWIDYLEIKPGDEVSKSDLSVKLRRIINHLNFWGFKQHIRKNPILAKYFQYILMNYRYLSGEIDNTYDHIISFEDTRICWLMKLTADVKSAMPMDISGDVEVAVRRIKIYDEIFKKSNINVHIPI